MPDHIKACPACGLDRTVRKDIRAIPHGRCSSCGLLWQLDPPFGDELASLYRTGFYAGKARGALLVRLMHAANNRVRMRELRGLAPGRLLDVGSGKGRFLAAARDAGWDVLGIEFADGAAEASRLAYGVDVVTGDFQSTDLPGPFDMITMWHTLEHLPDPFAAIERSASLITDGGHLLVSVPNLSSVQSRLGGDHWFHLDLPRHLYHFTPKSLRTLIERAGLDVERVDYFYPEIEVTGLLQTIMNLTGLDRDVMYRFIKRDSTARDRGGLLASFAIAGALLPAALIWSVAAPAAGSGASIQVLARARAAPRSA